MRVFFDNGVVVVGRNFKILVDPFRPFDETKYDLVLVTHGHSDHVTRHVRRAVVVLTRETLQVLSIREGVRPRRYFLARPGERLDFGKFYVHVLNAGHVPGSVMYVVESPEGTLGLTGDFNTAGSNVVEGADWIEADVLVMEATYGSRQYVFPPRDKTYGEILSLVDSSKAPVAIRAGPLGKGQELARLLPHRRLWLDPKVARLNRALGYAGGREYVRNAALGPGEALVLSLTSRPPPGFLLVELSGHYAVSRPQGHLGLPLSNHSDFPGLLEAALRSRAKRIYTVYGRAEELARWLGRLGLNASKIPPKGQTELTQWLTP
ncbi:MAG: MBL fold metallo-hydrolase [Thermoproteus sp.]